MLDGFLHFENTIPSPFCQVKRMQQIYSYLKYDIPEIFYVTSLSVQYYTEEDPECTLLPEYRFDACTVTHMLERMQQRYAPFLSSICQLPPQDREKEIHDLLVRTVTYRDVDAPYSHESPGPLLYGIGVCEGISKAFKYLADRAGLKAIVAVGVSCMEGHEEGHAWNLCEVEGTFFHLDVTFDATIEKKHLRYDYFNLSDREARSSRQWNSPLPECPAETGFYKREGLYFPGKQQLVQYLQQQSKKFGRLVFQLPPFPQSRERAEEAVLEIAGRHLLSTDKAYSLMLSSNLDRMVFCIEQEDSQALPTP